MAPPAVTGRLSKCRPSHSSKPASSTATTTSTGSGRTDLAQVYRCRRRACIVPSRGGHPSPPRHCPILSGHPPSQAPAMEPDPPMGTLPESECKQQISIAYAHAVVTAARCSMEVIRVDYDGVDVTIRQTAKHPAFDQVMVDVQLKCTSQDVLGNERLVYPLPVRNYQALIAKRLVPAILVVLVVPTALKEWLAHTESSLLLRRCAYWKSLANAPRTENTSNVTVWVPRSQQFTPRALLGILWKIGNKEESAL